MYRFGIALILVFASHFVSFDKYYVHMLLLRIAFRVGKEYVELSIWEVYDSVFQLDRKKIQWTAVLFLWKMRGETRERGWEKVMGIAPFLSPGSRLWYSNKSIAARYQRWQP